jgi:hypothetical protein
MFRSMFRSAIFDDKAVPANKIGLFLANLTDLIDHRN